jgi:hypothetical protein
MLYLFLSIGRLHFSPIFYRLAGWLAGCALRVFWKSYGNDKKTAKFLAKFTNKGQKFREFFNKLPILSCKMAVNLV